MTDRFTPSHLQLQHKAVELVETELARDSIPLPQKRKGRNATLRN